ncbi:hypothetical protein B7P43_G12380 [Cryptotermes secundus]|uniref:Tc1-like transposase DDE domain-containing protein n=1 Tax=Cryptotermes secundus TaxID=105785 RepID=A0A2J7RBK9_9NEOP|nr:hypothetical protein B7P43_G12380 [Cryptotermes secundus]
MVPLEVRRKMRFQYDGASAHCTNVVHEYLDMKNLVYETPVETQRDLVARIAVAAGRIREMPGIFRRVQHNMAQGVQNMQ